MVESILLWAVKLDIAIHLALLRYITVLEPDAEDYLPSIAVVTVGSQIGMQLSILCSIPTIVVILQPYNTRRY